MSRPVCFVANFTWQRWQRPQRMSRLVFFCCKFHMAKAPAYVTPCVFLSQISHGKGPSVCRALCFFVANFTWQRPHRQRMSRRVFFLSQISHGKGPSVCHALCRIHMAKAQSYVTPCVFLSQIAHGKGASVCHTLCFLVSNFTWQRPSVCRALLFSVANFTWQRPQRVSRPVFYCRKCHMAKAPACVTPCVLFVANFTWQRPHRQRMSRRVFFCRKFHMAKAPTCVMPCCFCRKFHMAEAPSMSRRVRVLSQISHGKDPYVTPCVFLSQILCHALCLFSQISHGKDGKGPSVCHALCFLVSNFTW